MSSMTFSQASDRLKKQGFYLVVHPVVIHHCLKDFSDYDIERYQFFIKPVGDDFVHVALIEYDNGRMAMTHDDKEGKVVYAIQIRYSCAGDDLLYGLRTKFNSGGSTTPAVDLHDVCNLFTAVSVRGHDRYIRKRFKHGRSKAKIRAFFIMLKDKWSAWRSY